VENACFCSELVADGFKRRSWRVKPLDFAYTPVFDEITVLCDDQRWEVDGKAGTALYPESCYEKLVKLFGQEEAGWAQLP